MMVLKGFSFCFLLCIHYWGGSSAVGYPSFLFSSIHLRALKQVLLVFLSPPLLLLLSLFFYV